MLKFQKGDFQSRRRQINETIIDDVDVELNAEKKAAKEKEKNVQSRVVETPENIPSQTTQAATQMGGKKMGRPRKMTALNLNNPKTIKFDDVVNRRLLMIKVDYKIDLKDIVYLATVEYLDKHFPGGEASEKDIAKIKKQISEIYGLQQ